MIIACNNDSPFAELYAECRILCLLYTSRVIKMPIMAEFSAEFKNIRARIKRNRGRLQGRKPGIRPLLASSSSTHIFSQKKQIIISFYSKLYRYCRYTPLLRLLYDEICDIDRVEVEKKKEDELGREK